MIPIDDESHAVHTQGVDVDLDNYEAAQRRRKRVGVVIGVAIVAVLVGGFLVVRAGQLPASDPKLVSDVREVLAEIQQIPAELRPELGSQAFAELEAQRLPKPLVEAFEGRARVPPDMRDLIMLAPFADDEETLKAWLLACPDGANVLADVGINGGGAAALFERCDLGRLGLLSKAELGRVSVGELVATHAAWAYLEEHRSSTELERQVLRLVLGRG